MQKGDLCLITGLSGFLATWIAKYLIQEGFRVRGTVRDINDSEKMRYLKNLLPNIEIVKANLDSITGWEKAMDSVKWVFHTASPQAISSQKENKMELSLEGINNVFNAAFHSSSVQKIVMTSSEGAICFGHPSSKISYTESDWTNPEYIGDYYKSKTYAEKAAWKIINNREANKNNIPLSVINPAILLGPSLVPWAGTSLNLIKNILDGKTPMFPDIDIFLVDVRDSAKMHITLMDKEESNGNRHLCFSMKNKMIELSKTIQKHYSYKKMMIPKILPKAMMWLVSFFNEDAKTVYPKIGKDILYKTLYPDIFDYEYSDFNTIICDTVDSMIKMNISVVEKKCT